MAAPRSKKYDYPPPIVLQNRDDWTSLRRRDPGDNPPCSIFGDSNKLSEWILGIGPIETPDITAIEQEMHSILEHNAFSVNGGRRWLGIDGISNIGKSIGTITAGLRLHDGLLNYPPEPKPGTKAFHVPVVFVSDHEASNKSLLVSIGEFAGVAMSASSTGPALIRQFRQVLPLLGTRMIIVDDAQMLRRVGPSRDLTDRLKQLVDALPVSFVFTGAGLKNSALLKRSDNSEDEYSAAIQLAGRMSLYRMSPFRSNNTKEMREWHQRIGRLIRRLESIDGFDSTEIRSSTFAANLFGFAGGSTGESITLLKSTSVLAVGENRSPTLADLLVQYKKGLTE